MKQTIGEKLENIKNIIRVKQWSKNFFVFIALIFSEKLWQGSALVSTGIAFIVFSLASSSVYVINDLFDRKQDALHEKKKNRPLASGKMRTGEAVLLTIILLAAAFAMSGAFLNEQCTLIIGMYIFNNILYSLWLKNIVCLDIISIAVGFVLRAIAGAAAINVMISPWLIITVFLLTAFIAISKRLLEKKLYLRTKLVSRKVLQHYQQKTLSQVYVISGVITCITYLLYTISAGKNPLLIYTVPLVIFGFYRYYSLTYSKQQKEDNPSDIIAADPPLLATLLLWLLLIISVLYWS